MDQIGTNAIDHLRAGHTLIYSRTLLKRRLIAYWDEIKFLLLGRVDIMPLIGYFLPQNVEPPLPNPL